MKRALILLVLASTIIAWAIFLPFSLHIGRALPNAVDPIFYAWNLNHNLQSATHGLGDLLDTNIFYPQGNTLAFSDTLYAQTLMTAPFLYLTKNPVLVENLYILITFPLSAIAMFLLSYYITKHIWASALSGLFFAFCYPRLAQIGHLPMISSQWTPLFILFFLKYLKSGLWKHLVGTFVLYLLNITSSIYFGVLLAPIAAVAVMLHLTSAPGKRIAKTLALWCFPFAVVLFIALYPYVRLKAEYPDIKRSLEDTGRLSASLADYMTILPTSMIARLGIYRMDINEKPLYPTIALLTLALLGILLGWKKQKKYVVLFALSGLAAFLLSFGPLWKNITMPYYYLYRIFPLMQIVRVPARFSIMVILSLSGLSAIGMANLRGRKQLLLCVLALAVFFIEVWQVKTPYVPIPVGHDIPAVYAWLAKEPSKTIIVELPIRPLWRGIPMEDQLMRTYRETREEDVFASETYRIYFSTIHNKRMINGYSGFFPQIYHDQAGLLDNFPTPESLAMLKEQHIRYILIHAWQYTDKPFSDIKRLIAQYPSLKLVQQFGDDYVYEL